MTKPHLLERLPENIYQEATWEELSAAVCAMDSWDEASAATLDQVYRLRMIQMLRSHASPSEIGEFSRHLGLAAHDLYREALNALSLPYYDRWRAWDDLLATRYRMLSAPGWQEAVLSNENKAEILYLVIQTRGIAQSRLEEHFRGRFTPPYLTRLLKQLEANLMIERQKARGDGRQKLVLPGSDAPEAGELKKYLSADILQRCDASLGAPSIGNRQAPRPAGPRPVEPGTVQFMQSMQKKAA